MGKIVQRSWPLFLAACLMLVYGFAAQAGTGKTLMMATTTSTDDTGLLNDLGPAFQKETGIELQWTATGTGKALKLGENCDVDVLLVHDPLAEKIFVENGFGTDRQSVMYNDFVLIGPTTDPAGIRQKPVKDAFLAIQSKQGTFVSRGDQSGTHMMELALWKTSIHAVPDKESWYVQTGQGMLATIQIAAERKGYALTDRGTYIKYENTHGGNPPLTILVEGDAALLNQYSVIAVNPDRCPKVKHNLASQFIRWMTMPDTQKRIGDFKLLGKPLFTPNADK